MPFDSRFAKILEEESGKAGCREHKAMLTNYHRDARIPDERASECSKFVQSRKSEPILDSLRDFTTIVIRRSRKGGFAGGHNEPNALGFPGRLPARRADGKYARVITLTSRGFHNSLIDGAQYSVRKLGALPSDFSSIPGANIPSGVASKGMIHADSFYEFCIWLNNIALTARPPFEELDQVFLAYRGYIRALEDPSEDKIFPYEPAWITPWLNACEYGLDPEKVDTWKLALGVQHQPLPPPTDNVFALLKYRVPPTFRLYRPTCLEAGCYAPHYPTHEEGECGHTMDCSPRPGTPPLKEWIHLNFALYSENLMALQRCGDSFPDLESNLEAWRVRHYGMLVAEYPAHSIPAPELIG